MTEMSGGRYVAEAMHRQGLTHAFYVPFIATKALMDMHALGIRRVQPHGEKAAAYMADGYARVSGRVGLCMAQSVGAANLAAGLQDPFLGRSPVLAITGREAQRVQQRHAYQEVDHTPLFAPVTKYSAVVPTAESLPVYLRQALRVATSGNPGPVHLDLDGFFGQGVIDQTLQVDLDAEDLLHDVAELRPVADDASITRALRVIAGAERPVIVAGGGALTSNAAAELRAVAERLQVPVAIAMEAKMVFPSSHPLAVGPVGTYSRACANQVVSEADLVIYVGCRAGGHETAGFTVPRPTTPTVHLDADPEDIGRNHPLHAGMWGDVRTTLARMVELIETSPERNGWVARAQELVAAWHESTHAARSSDDVPVRPERLCGLLAEHLPSNAVLVSDTGHSGVWTGTMIDLDDDQIYIPCAGSLGWALPASIGAKCAAPDRPVVSFSGDGGIWYHIAELETAARCGVNVVSVVNNNHSLNQERMPVEFLAGGRTSATDELWLFEDFDFAAMAESMGVLGITVHEASEFDGALDRALSSGRPALIDVKSDVEVVAPLAWRPPAP
jgi:acetolactate synthase I/II/III large subunit